MILYHDNPMFSVRHLFIHIVTANSSCKGLSHTNSRLGDVASCVDKNTRKNTKHPASPVTPYHIEYAKGKSNPFFTSMTHSAENIISNAIDTAIGVRYHGVGPSVAFPESGANI